MNAFKWWLVAFLVSYALVSVGRVGKPTEPMKSEVAVLRLLVAAALIFCVVRA